MNTLEYRARARQHASKADMILTNGIDADVPYAALELRKAIEAISYERILSYRRDISEEKLKTWQPHKVLNIVAAIDPGTQYTVTVEVELAEGSAEYTELGTEIPLGNLAVKKYYHSLGSYLHTPTIKQIEDGLDHDFSAARMLCKTVSKSIQAIIDKTNWVCSTDRPIDVECQRHGCNSKIRRNVISLFYKHVDHPTEALEIECFDCYGSYRVTLNEDDSLNVDPQMSKVRCQHSNCVGDMQIWHADARRALRENKRRDIECPTCGGSSQVFLGLLPNILG
jgi:hypothetical protein